MITFSAADSAEPSLVWVESMGGPLIVVPVSVLTRWQGCNQSGMIVGSGDVLDDYDHACEVEGLAGVISVGEKGAQGLVLADEPASSCYLPEHRAFVRWFAADTETDLIAAAERLLADLCHFVGGARHLDHRRSGGAHGLCDSWDGAWCRVSERRGPAGSGASLAPARQLDCSRCPRVDDRRNLGGRDQTPAAGVELT